MEYFGVRVKCQSKRDQSKISLLEILVPLNC